MQFPIIESIQNNAIANRALIDFTGITLPWQITARNNDERIEKGVGSVIWYSSAYFIPLILIKNLNKITSKVYKLPDKNLLKISNQYLSMSKLENWSSHPLSIENIKSVRADLPDLKEHLTKINVKLKNIQELKTLAPQIIRAKSVVLFSDILFSLVLTSSLSWITNFITNKRTGKTGFSAEFKMSTRENVEARAKKHRDTKRQKQILTFSIVGLASLLTTGLYYASLLKGSKSKTLSKIANKMHLFDYTNGLFSSKLTIFIITMFGYNPGALLAARDKFELREVIIKQSFLDFFFFVGDAMFGGLTALALDKLKGSKISRFHQVGKLKIPIAKSIREVKNTTSLEKASQEIKLAKINYISSLALTSITLATFFRWVNNYLTKRKVIRDDIDMLKNNFKEFQPLSPNK